jgi:hypothetical protein
MDTCRAHKKHASDEHLHWSYRQHLLLFLQEVLGHDPVVMVDGEPRARATRRFKALEGLDARRVNRFVADLSCAVTCSPTTRSLSFLRV